MALNVSCSAGFIFGYGRMRSSSMVPKQSWLMNEGDWAFEGMRGF